MLERILSRFFPGLYGIVRQKTTGRRRSSRPVVELLEDRRCPTSTTLLPISAFLSQQGHDMVFTPPVPDENAWTNSIYNPGTTPSDPTRELWVDYTGQAAQYLLQHGIDLHTKVTGFVTETPMGATGLMEVTVNLEATNALTWVVSTANLDPTDPQAANKAPLELGYRPQDLVANPGLKPALSTVHLQLTFQEQVGATLPDIPRLNENYNLYAPPGFSFEVFDFQSWGTGTLDAGTTEGSPGQTAIAYTTQVADLTHPNLPGTLADGFWQEPVDIVPVASASTHVAYLNGTLFVIDQSNNNDNVVVHPASGGGASVTSNLGNGTFAPVTGVVVALGGGNNNVAVAGLPAATIDVTALNGNNNVVVTSSAKLLVHLGGGNNNVVTGDTSPAAQFLCVGGSGNNNIITFNSTPAVILVAGNGNNNVFAAGNGDTVEVVGNGNNNIADTGTNDMVFLGGDGNNNIVNDGMGSFTTVWGGSGRNRILGRH
jgi:hypothetical protein